MVMPISSTSVVDKPGSPPEVNPRDRVRSNERSDAVALPGGFGVLLEATRTAAMSAVRGALAERASPRQMFEQVSTDAHERRANVMKNAFQADTQRPRTGERSAFDAPGNSEAAQSGRVRGNGYDGRGSLAVGLGDRATDNRSVAGRAGFDALSIADAEKGTARADAASRSTRIDGQPIPRDSASRHPSTTAPERAPFSTPTVSVRSTSAATASGSSVRATPAHQIGQILSASRGGAMDSARAVQSSPAPDGGKQTATRQAPQGSRGSLTRGDVQNATDRAGGGDSTERSTFDQLVRSIRMRTSPRRSSARLHLEPPALGRVLVDVRMDGSQMRIEVRAETPEAAELLRHRAGQLKSALREQGIVVDRFDVSTTPNGFDSPGALGDTSNQDVPARADERRATAKTNGRAIERLSDSTGDIGIEADSELTAVAERRLDVRV